MKLTLSKTSTTAVELPSEDTEDLISPILALLPTCFDAHTFPC